MLRRPRDARIPLVAQRRPLVALAWGFHLPVETRARGAPQLTLVRPSEVAGAGRPQPAEARRKAVRYECVDDPPGRLSEAHHLPLPRARRNTDASREQRAERTHAREAAV